MADSLQKKSKKELTDKKRTESFKGVRFFFYKLGLYRKVFLENGPESYKKRVNHGTIMKDNVGKEVWL